MCAVETYFYTPDRQKLRSNGQTQTMGYPEESYLEVVYAKLLRKVMKYNVEFPGALVCFTYFKICIYQGMSFV